MSDPFRPQAVAHLECVDRSARPVRKVNVTMYPGKTIRFGRDDRTNDYVFDHVSVSRNHLEFYSNIFDQGAEPMVYVRDRQSGNGTWINDRHVGRGSHNGKANGIDPGILLDHNDTVWIRPHWSFKVKLLKQKREKLTEIQKKEAEFFASQYTITDMIIGEGVSTKVRLACDVKTGLQVACKIYDDKQLRDQGHGGTTRAALHSLSLMSQIEHPNIASFQRAYKSDHNLYVFEELAAGGDLFSLVQRCREFKETEVRWIICQILRALEYLHAKDLAHRDLKPENILCMVCPKPAHRIALTDFGHVGLMSKGSLRTPCGTRGWQAPEQFRGDGAHSLPVDMWAVGLIACQLLAGNAVVDLLEKLEDTLPADPSIKSLDFDIIFAEIDALRPEPIQEEARDFIRGCLHTDPHHRMTAARALKHPWITQPHSIHLLFQSRQQQTLEGWKPRKVVQNLIQELPDVLNTATPRDTTAQKTKGNAAKPKRKQSIFGNFEVKEKGEKSRHFFGKVVKKPVGSSNNGPTTPIDPKVLRKVRDEMSVGERIDKFGKRGSLNKPDRVCLDRFTSPRRPRSQRDLDKLALLAELKKQDVKFLPRNVTWPLKAQGGDEVRCSTKRSRTGEGEGRPAKRPKIVLDPTDGKPINFEDPWTPV